MKRQTTKQIQTPKAIQKQILGQAIDGLIKGFNPKSFKEYYNEQLIKESKVSKN
ncbi:hypothetical protein SAMN06314019_10420 [Epsilonproteobacteria bacterium SCGC AD-311-C15]|jgi:hypothetical protein|nr:hypothetical protein SAMN06314019_10420 [Epsilonproteobacteria bacterium SCGC AD-311-C15]